MKKIFSALLIFCAMIFSATCQAELYLKPITEFEQFVGNWYDSKGNLALKIGKDYTINGCNVFALYYYSYDDEHRPNNFVLMGQSSADYLCRIMENGKIRDIELDIYGQDYFKILVANEKIYYNTINPKHFESVGGIYIGMNKNKVLSLYGQPSSIKPKINKLDGNEIWKYNNEGFDLKFVEDFVVEITFYSTGNRRFDWSGLSCRDSLQSFVKKYNYNSSFWNHWNQQGIQQCIQHLKWIEGGDGMPIGHGEGIYLRDYPNSITLKMNYIFGD